MDVIGKTVIFHNAKGYSTTIGAKEGDEWDNEFLPVNFKKGADEGISHGDEINIKEGFITFFVTKSKEVVFKIVVLEFEKTGKNVLEKTNTRTRRKRD